MKLRRWSRNGTGSYAALLSFTIANLLSASPNQIRHLKDFSNQEIFTMFLSPKRNITFSKTHMVNKKSTWLLNLRYSIKKIFCSNLFFFSSGFNYNLVIISYRYVIDIYVAGDCVMFVLFLNVNFINI